MAAWRTAQVDGGPRPRTYEAVADDQGGKASNGLEMSSIIVGDVATAWRLRTVVQVSFGEFLALGPLVHQGPNCDGKPPRHRAKRDVLG